MEALDALSGEATWRLVCDQAKKEPRIATGDDARAVIANM
jgi:hypothetical protein